MRPVLLACLSLSAACVAFRIRYVDFGQNRVDANISDLDVTENSIDRKFFWLYFLGYEEGEEEQVETISNITDLEHVDFYAIGQNIMPIFRNLPKIKHISIKGNNIIYLSNGALSSIPVKEIFLDNNRISVIETWSFGPQVNTLYLSCNRLTKISPRWFQNASNLREMDLSGNELTSLPGNIFAQFISLTLIVLSHNQISTIGPGAFSNRKAFWILFLDNNQITEISDEIFQAGPIEIQSMHLQYNRLTFLSEAFIEKTNTTKARISGNPWQCACYDMIRKWNSWEKDMYNQGTGDAPKCVNAPPYQPDCVPVVDFEFIEDYERKYKRKETRDQFCRTYLQ